MSERDSSWTNATALVTGGGRRLGRAIALGLARAGAAVVIHYGQSAAEADAVAAEARTLSGRAATVQADLAQPDQADTLIARAAQAAGTNITILVNCASIFPADTVRDMTTASLQQNVQVNAMAPLVLARSLAAQPAATDVVNLLDARIVDYDRLHAAYHLSKRMLFTITRMLALELAPAVKVNAVAPGLILPPPGADESFLTQQAHTNPLNRHGSAEDIVAAVMFLLASPFITGQVIFVDGGRHMKGCVYG
jgi:pteridine reductase